MGYPPLRDVPVTTMVLIGVFTPEIDIDVLFPLLPMAKFNRIVKKSRKVTLPLLKKGSILSARYKGVVLGEVKISSPRFFKNSITTDISVSQKNVNVKISKSKLHMCGIKNLEMARETGEVVLEHIREANNFLKLITPLELEIAKQYIEREDEQLLEQGNPLVLYRLLYYATCCQEKEQFDSMLETLSKALNKPLFDPTTPPRLLEINKIMVNYSASLGYKIKRSELAKRFNGREEFTSRFDNTVDYSVPIVHPHDYTANKKKDHPHITFTVYRSGIITISGPEHEVVEPVYEKFMRIMEEIRPYVTLEY